MRHASVRVRGEACFRIRRCTSHTPGAIFEARLLENLRGCQLQRDTSSENSRREVSNADRYGSNTISTAVEISSIENRPGGV